MVAFTVIIYVAVSTADAARADAVFPQLESAPAARAPAATDSVYCGLYCAYAAIRDHQLKVSFRELVRPEYLGSWRGSSTSEILRLLNDHQLHGEIFSDLSVSVLRSVGSPAILHVKRRADSEDFDHFVFYRGDRNGYAVIVDPPKRMELVPYSDLARRWNGTVLFVSPTPLSRSKIWTAAITKFLYLAAAVSFGVVACAGPVVVLQWRCPQDAGRFVGVLFGVVGLFGVAAAIGLMTNLSPGGLLNHSMRDVSESGIRDHALGQLAVVSHDEARQLWRSKRAVFVDARSRRQFGAGHIAGALNVPASSSKATRDAALLHVPKDAAIVVYCDNSRCSYSDVLATTLQQDGFQNVVVFRGGWRDWAAGAE